MLTKKDFLYDKRLADRFIDRKVITRSEYEKHIAKLEDVTDKSEPLVPPEELDEDGETDTE